MIWGKELPVLKILPHPSTNKDEVLGMRGHGCRMGLTWVQTFHALEQAKEPSNRATSLSASPQKSPVMAQSHLEQNPVWEYKSFMLKSSSETLLSNELSASVNQPKSLITSSVLLLHIYKLHSLMSPPHTPLIQVLHYTTIVSCLSSAAVQEPMTTEVIMYIVSLVPGLVSLVCGVI